MIVVSWNMGCARRGSRFRSTHEAAWRYLIDELRPDIALVQEAALVVPNWLRGRGQLFHRAAYADQDWGSGVLVRDRKSSEVQIALHGSYVIAAEIDADEGPFLAASIHVCPDAKQQRYLRELLDVLRPALRDRNFVVGGDLNAARLYDQVHRRNSYGWFFDELAKGGIHDCHWNLHQREVQSYWSRSGTMGYQDDHLFVSSSWAPNVRSCEVIDNDEVRVLSDHGPIRLVLNEGVR